MTDENFKKKIIESLEQAESIWGKVGSLVTLSESSRYFCKSITSNIPDHPEVDPTEPKVDDFIAFVLDIRGSSTHLIQCSATGTVSQLERVLYEITAVNTIGCIITKEKGGGITEFLGDGFLALYKVSNEDKTNVHEAHRAAKECIRVIRDLVNPILKERYNLEPLSIGIGMAYSRAIVTVMGYGDNLHPKALGECVFRATKLSDGCNEILIDDRLESFWPTSKSGKLRFEVKVKKNGFNGYAIANGK